MNPLSTTIVVLVDMVAASFQPVLGHITTMIQTIFYTLTLLL